jgi:copper homeostasis protein
LDGQNPKDDVMLLEVCIESPDDAAAAIAGGADRLEVNCALALGGLTPSAGLFAEVRRLTSIPLIAMVRPRPGGFCYSPGEFAVMLRDAESLLAAGADGLAFGILREDGRVDVDRCSRFRELCVGRDAVFHRAFDLVPDPLDAIEALIQLRVCRLITSGHKSTVENGTLLVGELVRRGAGRIQIMPAGGIRPHNVQRVVELTGCDQVHASLRMAATDPTLPAGAEIDLGQDAARRTDPIAVAELRRILAALEK